MNKKLKGIMKVLFVVIFVTLYVYIVNRTEFDILIGWTKNNMIFFVSILFILKTISNILPFIPAALFTFAAIPLIGWFPAYIINFTGGMVGSCIAYWLGKKYGINFLKTMFGENVVEKLNKLEFKKNKEFEAVFVFRLLLSQMSHILSYGAGIMGISFKKYFLATAFAGIVGILLFVVGGSISGSVSIIGSLIALLVFFILIYILRYRYFSVLPKGNKIKE
jgi:uncharacterized membrane protein YdjX (TVP38/TMEM64 family)